MVSNGRKVRFWTKVWLCHQPLLNFALTNIQEEEQGWNILSFVTNNNKWNWALLFGKLPTPILELLEKTFPPAEYMEDDSIAWACNASSKFSLNSALEMLAENK